MSPLLSRLASRLAITSVAVASAVACSHPVLQPDVACHVGAFHLANGEIVDFAPTSNAKGDLKSDALRWRTLDGRTAVVTRDAKGAWAGTVGWTAQRDSTPVAFGGCGDALLHFGGIEGTRVEFDVQEATFENAGAKLFGRLVLPKGVLLPAVLIEVHGSEKYSGVDFYSSQRLYPAAGVGVFVFDKRGTGRSTGKYT